MEKKIKVSPSLLAADFANLHQEVTKIIKAQADWIHFDIMDGIFVNNISFGLPVCQSLKKYPIFKDVHLMIANPIDYYQKFIEAGADLITFHLESIKYKKHVLQLIKDIKNNNAFVGISIKPSTPIETIIPYLSKIDLILIMSVEPGFGGQKFIPTCLDKVKKLRTYIDEHNLATLIEIDGGINKKTAHEAIIAGVDVLVAGSYIFKSNDYKSAIKDLKW